jgi:hypothetical protein
MDPFSIIAGALAAGAAAGLKETASKAVKEAYGGLAAALKKAYQRHTNVTEAAEHLAKKPTDKHRLVTAADHVLRIVEAEDPGAGSAVGVNIGLLRSEALEFVKVNAPERGTGVRIGAADIRGTTRFKDIGGSPGPK